MTASRERSTAVLGDQRAYFVAVFLKLFFDELVSIGFVAPQGYGRDQA
jgi:hypothetical protein